MAREEYDPGKDAYLRNPNYAVTPMFGGPGTLNPTRCCERCVFARGEHSPKCPRGGSDANGSD